MRNLFRTLIPDLILLGAVLVLIGIFGIGVWWLPGVLLPVTYFVMRRTYVAAGRIGRERVR